LIAIFERRRPTLVTDPIRDYLQATLPGYLADLHELVSIDSGTMNKPGVDAVATAMQERLRALGCEVSRLPNPIYGDSVVARLRGTGDKKVVMVGHTDTVYPDGTAQERPFHINDDRAYGPGTCDMKNGILAGLYAMKALKDARRTEFGELVLFLNSDEEVGSPTTTQAIDAECEDAIAVLVLESGRANNAVVVGRKGVYEYTLTAHGRSAHAGASPEKGRSAIHELAHKIVDIVALNGLSEGTTVNVGAIHGGTRRNVVADRATCEIDVRALSVQAHAELDRELRRILSEPHIPDTHIEVSTGHCFLPMERNKRNEGLYEIAREVASRLGFELTSTESGGGSDANHISARGVPVLDGLGPRGAGAHSPDEYLLIPSVVERTTLLAHLILELASRASACQE
jgi:glutamate carboxypeptidase